jgi:hypothetical protein
MTRIVTTTKRRKPVAIPQRIVSAKESRPFARRQADGG